MNKASINFSFGTIIGFALLFLVMVVIILVLSGKMDLFVKSNECTQRGGYCTSDCDGIILYLDGCNEGQVCCMQPT